MSWHQVQGHDEVWQRFRRTLRNGRLASTFLFVGSEGIGKRTFAFELARALLCSETSDDELAPCGTCESCRLFAAGNHPDFEYITKPKDRSSIPLELFIGRDDRRMREGLCHNLGMKPYLGGRKIAVIDDADYLNVEGANCLLKTLEEPPPRSLLILIGTSADKQLPTIRSRSQIIRFAPLSTDVVARLLVERGLIEDPAEAQRLAVFSQGSLARAVELADADLWRFRGQLLGHLANPAGDSVTFARGLVAFVDEAGREAAPRRTRARQIIGQAIEFYRQLIRALSGAPRGDDAELDRVVDRAAAALPGVEETAVACLDRCLDALEHIDRNANMTTVLEAWLDALASIYAHARRLTTTRH